MAEAQAAAAGSGRSVGRFEEPATRRVGRSTGRCRVKTAENLDWSGAPDLDCAVLNLQAATEPRVGAVGIGGAVRNAVRGAVPGLLQQSEAT